MAGVREKRREGEDKDKQSRAAMFNVNQGRYRLKMELRPTYEIAFNASLLPQAPCEWKQRREGFTPFSADGEPEGVRACVQVTCVRTLPLESCIIIRHNQLKALRA